MKILSVVGARPNFIKIAAIDRAIRKHKGIKHVIVHTGQHYDYTMSKAFFQELHIPDPDINLEVGSKTHARQVGEIMIRFEEVLLAQKPDVVLVVGDVNSTVAAALVAVKSGIAVAHVEAGLRSFDRNMPEEINRKATDAISDILFTTTEEASRQLVKEGVDRKRIFFVGNVMIDTLLENIDKAKKTSVLKDFFLEPQNYVLVTLHRPSNVDEKSNFKNILTAIETIQKGVRVVFPVHPRTKKKLLEIVSEKKIRAMKQLLLLEPLGYLEFMHLMSQAKCVITDSGGIQEETSVLNVPCLTVRQNTERPITIKEGTNCLVGCDAEKIIRACEKVLKGKNSSLKRIKFWDGKSATRIVQRLSTLQQKNQLRLS